MPLRGTFYFTPPLIRKLLKSIIQWRCQLSDDREHRNEVFGGAPGAPHSHGMPTRNVLKEDFGLDIPVENVPLPSLGAVYPADHPLHGQETVQIRAMTAKDEDILTSRALIKKGTVITHLLKSCLIDKSIDVDQMISGDRNALMISLRVTGYGAEYRVEVDCPACGERSKQNFDLTQLEINRLSISPLVSGSNLFEFFLPVTKKKVKFKFLTGNDEQEIMVTDERKKKQGIHTENTVTSRIQHALVSVGDVTDRNKISTFIRNMPARDSLELRRFIDKNEPGISMKTWMDCPSCLEHSEVRLPLGAAFFWPDAE